MIILDNIIVTDEFLNAKFCCCLPRCKGWCCVAGDAGAPLEATEIEQIEDNTIDGCVPDCYDCLGLVNGWFKIRINGKTGFVRADLMEWDGMCSF